MRNHSASTNKTHSSSLPKVVDGSGKRVVASRSSTPSMDSFSVDVPSRSEVRTLPNIKYLKTPDPTLALSYENDIRIETPKTERAMFASGSYGMVDLRFPNRKKLPQAKSLTQGWDDLSDEDDLDDQSLEDYFSPDLSFFTKTHNQHVESCFNYIQQPVLNIDIQKQMLSLKQKSKPERSDVYDDIQNMISSMKGYEEKQEQDLENEKKKNEFIKRKQKKNTSVKKQVDERLKILYNNPDELERLEKEISHYEKHMKQTESEQKSQNVHINKNKKVPENFKEHRLQQLKLEFKRRDLKIAEVKERKEKLERETQDRKENLALKEEKRRQLAEYNRQENENKAKDAELYAKWGFMTCYLSRFLIFARELLRKRYLRKEEEKFKRVKRIAYTKLMPVIWAKRSEKWKQAWEIFKKYVEVISLSN